MAGEGETGLDVRPRAAWPRGTVTRISHCSEALRGNPWNDPCERELPVYLPPQYNETGDPHLALWDLAAFTNSGLGHDAWRNHGEGLAQRLDRLINAGRLPPVVVPMPDCFTSLGGNQYVNSSSVGRYADYLNEELVSLVGERFNVIDSRDGRGIFGKSSGGYGALVQGMLRPDVWGAVASHAGDVGFHWVYQSDFPRSAQTLARYGGDPVAFLKAFWRKNRPNQADYGALLTVAMAASYDPQPAGSEPVIRLPFNPFTLEMDSSRWQKWLEHDPLNLVSEHTDALNSLHGLWLDVGERDQFHIQFGSRQLHSKLEDLEVEHHYEEFDGTHSGIDWRLDNSLPWLAERLKSATEIVR